MIPDPSALSAESFSLIAILLRAGWVVKAVMLVLAGASLWSWAIIIDKSVRFTALNRAADQFEDAVGSGRSLEQVAAEAGEKPGCVLLHRLGAFLDQVVSDRGRLLLGFHVLSLFFENVFAILKGLDHSARGWLRSGLPWVNVQERFQPQRGCIGDCRAMMQPFQG